MAIVGCTPYDNDYDQVYSGTEGLTYEVLDGFRDAVQENERFEVPLLFENRGAADLVGNSPGVFTFQYDTYYLRIDDTYPGPLVDNNPDDYAQFTQMSQLSQQFSGLFGYSGSPLMGVFSDIFGAASQAYGTGLGAEGRGTLSMLVLAKGKSLDYPNGDRVPARIPFVSRALNEGQQFQTTKILTQLCYPYVTMFGTDICINQDKYNLDAREKVCDDDSVYVTGSQGAPVTIEDIEVSFAQIEGSVAPRFLITLRNAGEGTPFIFPHESISQFGGSGVYADDVLQACTAKSQNRAYWNKAIVVPMFMGKYLQCANSNIVTFDEWGEAKTYCSFPGVIQDVYDQEGYGSYADSWELFSGMSAHSIVESFMGGVDQFVLENSPNPFSGVSGDIGELPAIPPSFRSHMDIKAVYFYVEHGSIDVIVERCMYCE